MIYVLTPAEEIKRLNRMFQVSEGSFHNIAILVLQFLSIEKRKKNI